MAAWQPPISRDEFEIAILCALPVEFDAIDGLLEVDLVEGRYYGKAYGDPNAYRTGRLGNHSVVVAYLPEMGKRSAAVTATWLIASFRNVKLGLVVGICGGVPYTEDEEEIVLGDIIISTGIIQFDYGRQFPNEVRRKDTLASDLSKPTASIRSFLRLLGSKRSRKMLREKTLTFLDDLCREKGLEASVYPGEDKDKLFEDTYRHKHQENDTCAVCSACMADSDPVCETALVSTCDRLGCSNQRTVARSRLQTRLGPQKSQKSSNLCVHFGQIASGDVVMKSARHRDQVASREHVIAFEMEGAGVWETFPTVVIKGVCDYADSHKSKIWQKHAAAVAAACTKAFLLEWKNAEGPSEPALSFKSGDDLVSRASTMETEESYSPNTSMRKSTTFESISTSSMQAEDRAAIIVPPQNDQQRAATALAILQSHNIDLEHLGANKVLLWAAKHRYPAVIGYALARGAILDFADEETGETALHIACLVESHEVVTQLINEGADMTAKDKSGRCALHIASSLGLLKCMAALLGGGADTEVLDKLGDTPLLEAALSEHADAVALLLDKGANISAQRWHGAKDPVGEGASALHFAAYFGDMSTVKVLLNRGAKLEMLNHRGHSPLISAAATNQGEVIKELLSRGANVQIVTRSGNGVLHTLLGRRIKGWEGTTAGTVQRIIEQGADVNARGHEGWTPLHLAIQNLDLGAVDMLLRRGARTDSIAKDLAGQRRLLVDPYQKDYPQAASLFAGKRK